jgi:hypothetical protein
MVNQACVAPTDGHRQVGSDVLPNAVDLVNIEHGQPDSHIVRLKGGARRLDLTGQTQAEQAGAQAECFTAGAYCPSRIFH